jgi:endonuclease I
MLFRNKLRPWGPLRSCAVIISLLAATAAQADAPVGYYDAVDMTTPATMRATLHTVIRAGHVKIPYTAASTDTWNVLELADQDPLDSGRIIDVYKNTSYIKYGAGNAEYDREHTWPKSFGFPNDGSSVLPYSDCHMLLLCNSSYNTSRSNNVYDTCTVITQSYPTAVYNGESGTNYRQNILPEGRWETWTGRRGDVARALLYFDVRYEGDGTEPDLILTDDINLIVASNTGVNLDVAYMGILTTLLQWHVQDPVSDRERNRNDIVYTYQHNRNPFIDHPEWVLPIFQGYLSGVGDLPLAAAEIQSIYPNPFNPNTNIAFSLPEAGQVRVEVFTVGGRLVRVLLNDSYDAGEHVLRWDGTDEAGGSVASGAYFFRVQNSAGIDTKPAILLK